MHLGKEGILWLPGVVRGKSFTLLLPEWEDFLEERHFSNHWKEDNSQSPQEAAFPQEAIPNSPWDKLSKLWKKLGCGQKGRVYVPYGTRNAHNSQHSRLPGSAPNLYYESDIMNTPGVPSTLDYSSLTKQPTYFHLLKSTGLGARETGIRTCSILPPLSE